MKYANRLLGSVGFSFLVSNLLLSSFAMAEDAPYQLISRAGYSTLTEVSSGRYVVKVCEDDKGTAYCTLVGRSSGYTKQELDLKAKALLARAKQASEPSNRLRTVAGAIGFALGYLKLYRLIGPGKTLREKIGNAAGAAIFGGSLGGGIGVGIGEGISEYKYGVAFPYDAAGEVLTATLGNMQIPRASKDYLWGALDEALKYPINEVPTRSPQVYQGSAKVIADNPVTPQSSGSGSGNPVASAR